MGSVAEGQTIDARTQAALARLTDNEKECLRRRLQQQTAKEMALDLGVSPHAVEKRLKMARTKLGLSSSLEAARLLAATEEYQQTGPQAAGLPRSRPAAEERFHRPLIFGGLVMILVTAAILALAAQSSSAPDGQSTPDDFSMVPATAFVDGTAEELRAYAEERFRTMDQDGSGFVERDEAPVPQIRLTESSWEGPGKPTREWIEQQQSRAVPLDPVMAQAAYISQGDTNADGRLTFDEYLAIRNAAFDAKQVPVRWREQRQATALPAGHIAPSEAEIVHMTQTTFHHVDADNSGYIDGVESPIGMPRGPQPVYRRDEEGKVVRTGEMVMMDEDEIRAQFYLLADKDGDGRISYPEFHHWSAPNLVRNGIPAAWREDIRRWMSTGG